MKKKEPTYNITSKEVAIPFRLIKQVMDKYPTLEAQRAIEDLVGIVVYNILKNLK